MKFKDEQFKVSAPTTSTMDEVAAIIAMLEKKKKKEEEDVTHLEFLKQVLDDKVKKYVITHIKSGMATERVYLEKDTLKDDFDEIKQELVGLIKERRTKSKPERTTFDYYNAKREKINGTFQECGSILWLAKNNKKTDPYTAKKPYNKEHHIGVELEFNSLANQTQERSEIAGALKIMRLGKYCRVTSDPSCGHEVNVLLPENNWEPILKQVIDVILGVGDFRTDDRCGAHVHFDMRHREVSRVYRNLFYSHGCLLSLIKKERRGNRLHPFVFSFVEKRGSACRTR